MQCRMEQTGLEPRGAAGPTQEGTGGEGGGA